MGEKLKEVKIAFISTTNEITFTNVISCYFSDYGKNTFYVVELKDEKNTIIRYNAKDIDNIWEEDVL